jgi:hypothetical protein
MYIMFLVSYSATSFYINQELGSQFWIIFIISAVSLVYLTGYELIQFYMEKSFYLKSPKNLAELFTFTFSIVTLIIQVTADPAMSNMKSSIYSITIIMAYLVFLLRLNKLPYVGIYVSVFGEVLKKSLKFLAIVFIVMTGFFISFQIRSDFDRTYPTDMDNNVDKFDGHFFTSVFLIVEMMLGGFEGMSELGLGMTITHFNIANYVNLALFMFVVTIVLHNLFLGIAVEELSKMVDDAELQYIIMKIEYTMRVRDRRWVAVKVVDEFTDAYEMDLVNRNEASADKSKNGSESMRNELELLKQDVDFMKTSILSSDSSEAINRISEQIQVLNNENSVLNAKLDEILQKINTSLDMTDRVNI